MGGFGSGRSGGLPTVEGSLGLDLYELIRGGFFRPGCSSSGSLTWSYADGEHRAAISCDVDLSKERGWIRLRYTSTTWDGQKRASDYRVELATTPQPFGGRRWWFVCPKRGDLVAKLYLPAGAFTFASRKAYRLGYRSQRASPRDRAIDRAFKLRRRLGASGGIGEPIDKPKGMRWRTFKRLMDRVEAAEEVVDEHLLRLLRR